MTMLKPTIGIVGGGFIAHRMNDTQSSKKETNFKNYDK